MEALPGGTRPPGARPTRRALTRYALFQLPGLGLLLVGLLVLRQLVRLEPLALGALTLLWIVKDILLFPLVWRAYADDVSTYSFSLVGRRGTVIARLAPSGQVRVHGEIWRAQAASGSPPLDVGARVRIVSEDGLLLTVEPWP